MPTLWTFGYSGLRDADALRRNLGDAVELVIDVRLSPFSRNPAWSRGTRSTVEAAGFAYRHLPGLGNAEYRSGGMRIAEPEDAQLVGDEVATGRRLALMCVCADAATCHRTVVADLVRSLLPGLQVIDLQRADVGYTPNPCG